MSDLQPKVLIDGDRFIYERGNRKFDVKKLVENYNLSKNYVDNNFKKAVEELDVNPTWLMDMLSKYFIHTTLLQA